MKRIIFLLTALVLMFALVGCDDTQTAPDAGAPHQCADQNGDDSCDGCGAALTQNTPEPDNHPDAENDGYCDNCGSAMCVLGMGDKHFDDDKNCVCDHCSADTHLHGEELDCGKCQNCGLILGIYNIDGDDYCDLCGWRICTEVHPHRNADNDEVCDFCSAVWVSLFAPETPVFTMTVTGEAVQIDITPAAGIDGYTVWVNDTYQIAGTSNTTITIASEKFDAGQSKISVQAYNQAGSSPMADAGTVGKLEDPVCHATGTGIEFIWGDVANAEGYIIYGDDGAYLATIGLGETVDFAGIYTVDGFYFPGLRAYADGWLNSDKCGIPVSIGSNGGPIGGY